MVLILTAFSTFVLPPTSFTVAPNQTDVPVYRTTYLVPTTPLTIRTGTATPPMKPQGTPSEM